jgi:hypothetical protein
VDNAYDFEHDLAEIYRKLKWDSVSS